MVRFLVVGLFACLEFVLVILFTVLIAYMLAQVLDVAAPDKYDSSAEQEILDAVNDGFKTEQITAKQRVEILQIYRDERDKIQKLRTNIIYAISICISAGLSAILFKKYRTLRIRERFRYYFFPPKP